MMCARACLHVCVFVCMCGCVVLRCASRYELAAATATYSLFVNARQDVVTVPDEQTNRNLSLLAAAVSGEDLTTQKP